MYGSTLAARSPDAHCRWTTPIRSHARASLAPDARKHESQASTLSRVVASHQHTPGQDGGLRKYDTRTGEQVAIWAHGTSGEPIEILDLALSQDGSFVYTAGEDGAVCQFAATSGTLLRRLHEHRRPCTCVRTAVSRLV